MATVMSFLFAKGITLDKQTAKGFELNLRMTAPEQTLEQAQGGIKDHAQALLEVKEWLEEESWKEAQKELRSRAAFLKQDIYTIIQAKPGSQRPLLRKLYSDLGIDGLNL